MCEIYTADIPRNLQCLDERRFLLIIPAGLDTGQRELAARSAFEAAGQEQEGDEVTCLCGLEAEFPREEQRATAPAPCWRQALPWLMGILLWMAGEMTLILAHLR